MITLGRRRIGWIVLFAIASLLGGCSEKKPRRARISDEETPSGRKQSTLTYLPVDRGADAAEAIVALKGKLARAKLTSVTAVRAVGDHIEVDVFGEDESVGADVKEAIATRRLTVAKVATSPDPLAFLRGDPDLPPRVSVDTRVTRVPTAVLLFPKQTEGAAALRDELRVFVNKKAGSPLPIAFGCDDGPCTTIRSYALAEVPVELHVVVAEAVVDAQGPLHRPEVMVELSAESTKVFGDLTRRCIDEPIAMMLDDEVLMAPIVRGAITGGSVRITMGEDAKTMDDARRLARRIRASGGPLLELVSENR